MRALLVSEVRRILRSPRFLIFTVGLPLIYLLIFSGIYAPGGGETVVVLMVMMAAFGAISASISVGGRVAAERHVGWNRQLRLPFAAIGLLIGMAAIPDSAQGMSTVVMLLFSLLGGVLIPAQVLPAVMVAVAQFLPSYWIVVETMGQAFGAGVDGQGVLVMLAWLVVVGALVAMRYRHDALRV
jgi:ABC-2 type transport system permease protein